MAADLSIHVFVGITEEDLRRFREPVSGHTYAAWSEVYDRIGQTPHRWIGEVSWLGAMLGDGEGSVPSAVMEVERLIGGDRLPTLTPELVSQLCAALGAPNTTGYDVTQDADGLRAWLEQHLGARVFTVSW